MSDHRAFIRHPSEIPIEFALQADSPAAASGQAQNVSLGGLAFESDCCPEHGSVVEICIPLVKPAFRTRGEVVWCRSLDSVYEVGVRFLESSAAFRTRMVEQVCHIEDYRRAVREREGRDLSSEAAAQEWIQRFAADFPDPRRAVG